jgi:hypothetical protein
MGARYTIMVREYQPDKLVELCSVSSNPEMVAEGVRSKTLLIAGKGSRRIRVPKYEHVEIIAINPHREGNHAGSTYVDRRSHHTPAATPR